MSEILKGLVGQPWEKYLLIGGRRSGKVRLMNCVHNVLLIEQYRATESMSDAELRDFILDQYDIDMSYRTIFEARQIIKMRNDSMIIKEIVSKLSDIDLPDELSIMGLLSDSLSWLVLPERHQLVALALRELGYERHRTRERILWKKKIP